MNAALTGEHENESDFGMMRQNHQPESDVCETDLTDT